MVQILLLLVFLLMVIFYTRQYLRYQLWRRQIVRCTEDYIIRHGLNTCALGFYDGKEAGLAKELDISANHAYGLISIVLNSARGNFSAKQISQSLDKILRPIFQDLNH